MKAHELVIAKWLRDTGPPAKQVEAQIDGVRGLSILVKPTGSAFWCVRFQVGSGAERARHRKLIGRCGKGGLSLADAASAARRITEDAEKGLNIVAVEQARAKALTLRQLFAERKAKDSDTAGRTLSDYEEALERDVFKELGETPAAEITTDTFARVLERIEDRAKHAAHKVRSALGSTYRWAQGRRLVTVNPISGLAFTHQSKRRKLRMDAKELGKLWRAIDAAGNVAEPTKNIIRLAILTGQRNSEAAGMEVGEVRGLDTETPLWEIPARRMKRKSDDQYIPLSRQAAAVVRAAIPAANDVHVFPGTTHGRLGGTWRQEHVGQETVSGAFKRITEGGGVVVLDMTTKQNMRPTLHDMRKVVTTWLTEVAHVEDKVLDAILHHGRQGVTGTRYNFALHDGLVRAALQSWADHVDRVAADQPATNIIELTSARA
jgi:integrase